MISTETLESQRLHDLTFRLARFVYESLRIESNQSFFLFSKLNPQIKSFENLTAMWVDSFVRIGLANPDLQSRIRDLKSRISCICKNKADFFYFVFRFDSNLFVRMGLTNPDSRVCKAGFDEHNLNFYLQYTWARF